MGHTDLSGLHIKLQNLLRDSSGILPEVVLALGIVFLLILTLIPVKGKKGRDWVSITALLVLSLVFFLDLDQWLYTDQALKPFGMLWCTPPVLFLKAGFTLVAMIVVLMSFYPSPSRVYRGEYYLLLLTVLLGASLMVLSTHMVMLYLSLEMVSLASYALSGFSFDRKGAEGSLKYVLFGIVASGVMLYGMSLQYGLTGDMALDITTVIEGGILSKIAILMVMGGFLFKLSAVPFHLWAPDVYESAPTPVVAFFSIVPKVAGIMVMLAYTRFFFSGSGLGSGGEGVQHLLAVLAIMTMLIGNLSALGQSQPKRLMAYSSIAHSGFFLAALLTYSTTGLISLFYYVVVYAIMNLAAFFMLQWAEVHHGLRKVSDFAGLYRVAPFYGVLLVIVMVSLTGLPPTAGFTAKMLVFGALWESYTVSGNIVLLTVLVMAVANTLIALFYYLKIPYYIFFKPLKHSNQPSAKPLMAPYALMCTLTLLLLLLFFKPEWLMELLNNANFEP